MYPQKGFAQKFVPAHKSSVLPEKPNESSLWLYAEEPHWKMWVENIVKILARALASIAEVLDRIVDVIQPRVE